MSERDKTIKERMKRMRQRKNDRGLTRREVWAKPEHWPALKELENALQENNLGSQAKCHACGVITFLPPGVCANCGKNQWRG